MHNSIEDIFNQSMANAFTTKEDTIIEELTEEEKRKQGIADAIAESREARRIKEEEEAELAEVVKYKSEKATTSDEKQKEIVEKSVKNKIEINPDIKESIVGKIYAMYNNKYLSEKKAKKDYDGDGKVESGSKEHAGVVHNAIQKKKGGKPDGKDTRSEAYTVTNADKKGNTPAYQGYKAGKKSKVDGKPMYKAADHMKEGMKQARKNVGASTCWDGYTAKGTKKKGGKEVPNCVKEDEVKEGYGKKKASKKKAVKSQP
tara:strand:- start:215 stop:991 length:777 start_codon:yes stop_codon:yes gene_type:complete